MRPRLWLATLLLGVAAPAVAQTPVINPTKVLFDSTSHTVVCPADGCVVNYTIEVWGVGVDPITGSPISTSLLDKAKVAVTGTAPAYRALMADCTPPLSSPPGTQVVVRMVAVGQYLSSARSTASPPFVRAGVPATPSGVNVAP